MATEKTRLERINELAALAKQRELTEEEKSERERLRKEYLAEFRRNVTAQLDNVYIVDAEGKQTKLKRKD